MAMDILMYLRHYRKNSKHQNLLNSKSQNTNINKITITKFKISNYVLVIEN